MQQDCRKQRGASLSYTEALSFFFSCFFFFFSVFSENHCRTGFHVLVAEACFALFFVTLLASSLLNWEKEKRPLFLSRFRRVRRAILHARCTAAYWTNIWQECCLASCTSFSITTRIAFPFPLFLSLLHISFFDFSNRLLYCFSLILSFFFFFSTRVTPPPRRFSILFRFHCAADKKRKSNYDIRILS